MAYHKTLGGEVTTRLRFSENNNVNTRAVSHLEHNLDIFFERTGLEPRGARGVLPPEGMTHEEEDIFNDILEQFMNDSLSAQEIKEEYSKRPKEDKKSRASMKDKAEQIEKAQRVANDERLRQNLYSTILQEVFTLTRDNKWNTNSVYNAMIDALDELDEGFIGDTREDYVNAVIDKMESGFY